MSAHKKWEVMCDGRMIATVPLRDDYSHEPYNANCACNPRLEVVHDCIIFYHNAYDLREVKENMNKLVDELFEDEEE
jgi:hypothetical protein